MRLLVRCAKARSRSLRTESWLSLRNGTCRRENGNGSKRPLPLTIRRFFPAANNKTSPPKQTVPHDCRNIEIPLIHPRKGEQKEQTCAFARLRRLRRIWPDDRQNP